jgi:hypothetical protein
MDSFAVAGAGTGIGSIGTVTAHAEGLVLVWTGESMIAARRALTCLVVPEIGDTVLVADGGTPCSFVLAILERPGGGELRIAAEGDLSIETPGGRFAVRSGSGLDLATESRLTLGAARIDVRAQDVGLFLGSVMLVAGAVDAMLERLSQTARRVFRQVEEVDHLRAGHIDYAAAGMSRLHGGHMLLTATELVKTDAKQIHVG